MAHYRRCTLKLLICSCVLFCACFLSGCSNSMSAGSASDCFQKVFHRLPPPTVLNLRGEGHYEDDGDVIFLSFNTSKHALFTMVQTHPQHISRLWFIHATTVRKSPSWWKPLSGNPKIFIRSAKLRDNDIGGGAGYIACDPINQTVSVYSYAQE